MLQILVEVKAVVGDVIFHVSPGQSLNHRREEKKQESAPQLLICSITIGTADRL